MSLFYQKNGGAAGDQLGFAVAPAGDVNGDGRTDFIIGAPFASPGGMSGAGSAFVYSGATGSLLYQKNGAADNDRFGYSVASAGDINGDGKADFIIAAPFASPGGTANAGSVYLYSGMNGSLLYQKDGTVEAALLGYSIAYGGDVNGDGNPDFISGVPFDSAGGSLYAGSIYVYSGPTGALIYRKTGAGNSFGNSVAGVGDANGDGKTDFIVGAPSPDTLGNDAGGGAYLYSGADGSLLYQKNGAADGDNFGSSVAVAGDMNGDGKADFIVGASLAAPGGALDAGSAYVYSGATGTLLYQKDGAADGDNLGAAVATAGDVTGDGRADFIIGATYADPGGRADAGSAYVYSGADGSLLHQKNGLASGDNLGFSVTTAGDVTGDGISDFIIAAPLADPGGALDAGSIYLYGICSRAKGDMNDDGRYTGTDAVAMLNCVFLGTGNCDLCFSDLNCTGTLTSTDAVIELNATFLGTPITIGCP